MITYENTTVKTLSTRLLAVLVAATICCGLGTATTVSTAQAATTAPQSCPDPDECSGGGGGGGNPGTPTAPASCSQGSALVYSDSATSYSPDCGTGYRIHAYTTLLRWDSHTNGDPAEYARMQSYVRFERTNGDGLDARGTRVACHDTKGGSDSDHEDKATKTTVTYNTGGAAHNTGIVVTCEHQATYNNTTYYTTTVQVIVAP
jgi:hypothetical protein